MIKQSLLNGTIFGMVAVFFIESWCLNSEVFADSENQLLVLERELEKSLASIATELTAHEKKLEGTAQDLKKAQALSSQQIRTITLFTSLIATATMATVYYWQNTHPEDLSLFEMVLRLKGFSPLQSDLVQTAGSGVGATWVSLLVSQLFMNHDATTSIDFNSRATLQSIEVRWASERVPHQSDWLLQFNLDLETLRALRSRALEALNIVVPLPATRKQKIKFYSHLYSAVAWLRDIALVEQKSLQTVANFLPRSGLVFSSGGLERCGALIASLRQT